nr:MAG TPA: hypothetical protein [Caudoviricetes sp.]
MFPCCFPFFSLFLSIKIRPFGLALISIFTSIHLTNPLPR